MDTIVSNLPPQSDQTDKCARTSSKSDNASLTIDRGKNLSSISGLKNEPVDICDTQLAEKGIDEADLFGSCFLVGGIQSLTVSSETSSLRLGKGSAKLVIPNEAFHQCQELKVEYATILDGPFCIPDDCYIVSPVLYLDFDTTLVKKPLELYLNHWYAGEYRQKSMTFLKAPHVASADGYFHFSKIGSSCFSDDENFGILTLQNDLCLICCAVQRSTLSFPMACRITLLTKQGQSPGCTLFAVYLTFDSAEWTAVINKFIKEKRGWTSVSEAGPQPITFEGRCDGVKVFAMPDENPHHWTIQHDGCSEIRCSQLVQWIDKYHLRPGQSNCNVLREEIDKRYFPPCIQLRLTYARDPTMWTSTQNVLLVVKSLQPHTEPMKFPLQVKIPGNGASCLLDAGSKPTLEELDKLIVGRCSGWEQTALCLGVQSLVIETEKWDNHEKSDEACRRVLRRWLLQAPGTGETERTWHSVLEALKTSGHSQLTEQLKREHFPFWQPVVLVGDQKCDMMLRTFVSKVAAGKGRAVLEGLGLTEGMREMCFVNNPFNVEEAIQCGLLQWKNGHGKSPTWEVLLRAISYAKIAVQDVNKLKEEILKGPDEGLTSGLKDNKQVMESGPVSLASDVAEGTVDEDLLQQLCYMATGMKQLLISPDGGTFKLGSGDASLVFPPGAVEKKTFIHYAIILHGPFVLPAGYKLGSVGVYLNMDGITLVKPVQLFLCHWCIKQKEDDTTLKFIRAPHTLEVGVKTYTYEEVEEKADFTTYTNVGVLTIREPRCLYCVETKVETIAKYNAIILTRNVPSNETLFFRIQLMCDSLAWSKKLTGLLEQKGWQHNNSDIVPRFSYSSAEKPIEASAAKSQGLGWVATIEGQHQVQETDFLMLKGKSKSDVEEEVNSGRFPPCLCYKILYTSPEERRVRPALLKVDLLGADVRLTFSCTLKEEPELSVPSPISSGPSQSAQTPPSSPQTDIHKTADVIRALNHQLDAEWRELGTFLHVDPAIMDRIDKDRTSVRACMLQLVEDWVWRKDGTGDLPRTWTTMVQALKDMGAGVLAQQLHGRPI